VGGTQVGIASWYGPGFHGQRTASGEVYDQHALTAAHPSLPLGTRVSVTNLTNGRSVVVRINDRGPYVDARVIDLSYAAARAIGMVGPGTARVRLRLVDPVAPGRRRSRASSLPAVSYAVQVAALRDPRRADRLRAALARRFADTFVSRQETRGSHYYRVRIGPYAERGTALVRARLVTRLGLPAMIVEEDPL
jgi:rare lipoprotein A